MSQTVSVGKPNAFHQSLRTYIRAGYPILYVVTAEEERAIDALLKGSRANGPGRCNVVWFQGCTLGCPGCFNPGTHDPSSGEDLAVEQLAS